MRLARLSKPLRSLRASHVSAALVACVACVACSESRSDSRREGMPPTASAATMRGQVPAAGAARSGDATDPDDPPGQSGQSPAMGELPPYNGPYFGSTVFRAAVLSDMEWPPAPGSGRKSNVVQLGYIRHGQKAPVIPEAHKKENCKEGWYELVAGGFVCGKYGTLDLNHPRFKLGHPPDLEAALPYTYGMNGYHGTPLYRHVPSREERLKYEPWLAKGRSKPRPAASTTASTDTDVKDDPYDSLDAGAATTAPEPAATASATTPVDDTPWYLKDYDGGAGPAITLDELREEGGLVAKRMVKGFYVSIDKKFEAQDHSSWWKLNDGFVAPVDRVWPGHPQAEYKGIWLNDPTPAPQHSADGGAPPTKLDSIPIGFITSKTARKWIMADSRKHVTAGGALHRWTAVHLTNEAPVTVNGSEYFQTDEGWWMRGLDGTKTEPGPPPPGLLPNEKWVDVNLKRQTLVAFEGEKAVFATIISSGRPGHETPPGTFRIREKHIASTMDGDAETATDGPYSIQDVPYIQYFSAGYALHGAFWHSNFGHVQSHGCVNLAPLDAKAIFGWTEPQLPDGWHGVNATHAKPGTRVLVHF